MKKIISVFVSAIVLFSFGSCSDSDSEKDASDMDISSSSVDSEEKSDEDEEDSQKSVQSESLEILNNIEVYVLDCSVLPIEETMIDQGTGIWEDDIAGFDKGTIVTLFIDYGKHSYSLEDRLITTTDGQELLQTSYDTMWSDSDEDGSVWIVERIRIPGEYDIADLEFKLIYDDDYDTTVSKPLSNTMTFEELSEKCYWQEDVNPNWEDAEEAEMYNPIHRTYIYKIKGRYCMVDNAFGDSSGSKSSSDGTKIEYGGIDFEIIPLEGSIGSFIEEADIQVESGNTETYMWSEFHEYENRKTNDFIDVRICCKVSDADWYVNWDSLTEEERQLKSSVDDLIAKYFRYEARETFLLLPDGEGGTTRIECVCR
ncbi:MAG: hypothetical protein IJX77_08860 [Ruminococcus sp.]|nr:hypothetical protein [Ruminococcus sp.]